MLFDIKNGCKINDFITNVVLGQVCVLKEIVGAMYGLVSIPTAGVQVQQ
jgi:hypothetical protein